jgi:hypothetical protein
MLTEDEWRQVERLLLGGFGSIIDVRKRAKERSQEFKQHEQTACDRYFELTGERESKPEMLWHHRLSIYGPECRKCGHLLRTPKASFCANCGEKAEKAKSPGFWRILGLFE